MEPPARTYRLEVACIVDFFGHKTVHVCRQLVLADEQKTGSHTNRKEQRERRANGTIARLPTRQISMRLAASSISSLRWSALAPVDGRLPDDFVD